jgi:membrane protein implicated in regulation of membrane protease activity
MSLETLVYWHWWILAIGLIILEIFAPGAIFLWMGIAASIVGIILMLFPDLTWQIQFFIFSLLSIASIVVWHYFLKKNPTQTDQPMLNKRGHQYVGRTFTLDEAIVNNVGKIKVDDSTWKVEGENCEAGSQIKVVDVDGVVLKIEAI